LPTLHGNQIYLKMQIMKNNRCLGVWMDHHEAHLMEFSLEQPNLKTIQSSFTQEQRAESMEKGEKLMHHKEHQMQEKFYKQLGLVIQDYDEVLLFGPTEAKVELFNRLREEKAFSHIHFSLKKADKMTEHQQQAFVREFFNKPVMHEVLDHQQNKL
jgi:Zn-finger nucleic acid-binding protein